VRRLFTLLLAASVAASACGAGLAYAARVNSAAISRSSLDGELKDISQNKGYVQAFDQQTNGSGPIEGTTPGTFNQAFVADLLTQRIEYALIHQELQRRHALPDSAAVQQARQEVGQSLTVTGSGGTASQPLLPGFPSRYQNTLVERRAEVDALRNALGKSDVSDQAVRRFYDTNPNQFVTEICVRHILVADRATAARLKSQLDGGADFATLAKASSTDQQSAVNGGKLSGSAPDKCLTSQDAQQLVTEFGQAMVALPVNQVSPPVQSQFGFHLIEVTSRTVEPFDQSVIQAARQQLARQAFVTVLNKLVQQASVKVDAQFGHFDKKGNLGSGQGPAVVPPKGPQISSGGSQPVGGSGPLSTSTTAPGG
jgi:parvulin-like peptidyl-prolyl isomerase